MMMKIRSVIVLLSALLLATSCLNTDETEYTYYNDTAINSFTLGTLNQYYWGKTKYTDKDSLYKTTVTGSNYKFYIDQSKNEIYNNDSLPKGTDAAHVICTVNSVNSGLVVIRYENISKEDSLVYYSSSDSIDFSEPREFRVYANDGSAYRKYTVKVNVHQEDPDSFRWNNCATVDAFKAFTDMKAVGLNDKVMLLGTNGSKTNVYTTANSDGKTWTKGIEEFDADTYKNTAVLDGTLYAVSKGLLFSTTDGETWTEGSAFAYKQLLGAGSKKLYALTADGKITASADNGATWTNEKMDASGEYLPADEISLAVLPSVTNKSTEDIILTGLRDLSANPSDTAAVVWSKVEEYADGSDTNQWVHYESDGGYKLPALANVSMMRYGNVLVAMGGSPEGDAQSKAFSGLYMSRDKGLTWHTDSKYVLPEGFTNDGSDVFAIAAGKDNILWIISGGTGQVWRGRLNKLGWKVYQSTLTE